MSGIFWEISMTRPGTAAFRSTSGTFPENYQDISGILPGHLNTFTGHAEDFH